MRLGVGSAVFLQALNAKLIPIRKMRIKFFTGVERSNPWFIVNLELNFLLQFFAVANNHHNRPVAFLE